MSPTDHNRTLALVHGFIASLMLIGLLLAALLEMRRRPDAVERLVWMLYVLPLPVLQLLTAYGLLTIRRWGRVLALALCGLYVWLFPLGTLLGGYTWWFLFSDAGRQLYGVTSSTERID
jgi:glycerol uptake facilitator-like aquaporin